MQQQLNLKPTHKLVKNYYEVLGQFGQLSIDHEMAVRSAFQSLLAGCGRQFDWTLVPEYAIKKPPAGLIKVDGAMVDTFRLTHGFWEAKDEHDDLEKEIRRKLEQGYPRNNMIFQAPERAILYQNGIRQGLNDDIRDAGNLVELLKTFFAYREPHHEEWDEAVAAFKDHIPEIAKAVQEKIEEQQRTNKTFAARFQAFYDVCRQSINPNLSVEAVERMLVQHLLTERIFRRIFDNPDFTRRNVIALEIEKVIDAMTAKQFSRDAFLKDLDRFYKAIELAADSTEDYSEKQHFINTVYERFFQGYSPKEADTHGIVYTPQPIVDFMVRSVEDILQKEFGRSLSDKGVHILDPFVGTGNFITRVMKEMKTSALPYKYENELHCNEVMLLPYYVASMNIEHEYMERTGEYKPFPGICLVDTFDMRAQTTMFAEENLTRIQRQNASPIFVVIANPPYNAWQVSENDNNRNRKYPELETRVQETYGKLSHATNKSALWDPYVKAFRWATDRIREEGVIAFVSNGAFVESLAADGMRASLAKEFDEIYILDLGGNVRKNPKLSGTTHNVFGIQVGVCISLLVRLKRLRERRYCTIRYARSAGDWTKEEKYSFLDNARSGAGIKWAEVVPSDDVWLRAGLEEEFATFVEIGNAACKAGDGERAIFVKFGRGVETTRDSWLYNFDRESLLDRVSELTNTYNSELARWKANKKKVSLDDFLQRDETKIKWSSSLKQSVVAEQAAALDQQLIQPSLYRPFTRQFCYFHPVFVHRRAQFSYFAPPQRTTSENRLLALPGPGSEKPFHVLLSNGLIDLHLSGGGASTECFAFYRYDEDGSNRRENITDWALNEFRKHYNDPSITKWDIFHYVYAVLHHPEYRLRYAANLKRELPRIPLVGRAGLQASVPADLRTSGVGLQPDGTAGERPGLQAGEKEQAEGHSSLPKANAQPQAERQEQIPRSLKAPRDDKPKEAHVGTAEAVPLQNRSDAGRGPEGPLYQDAAQRGAEAPLYQTDREVFWAFAEAGRQLADLHVNYEQQEEYPLEQVENPRERLNWRVQKMRLGKDKTTLTYNNFLTLKGIPPETYEYRLGNRSALEWVIDQYQVTTDKRSGIVNDPNRADDPEYIVHLIGQVITVSLETMRIIKALPEWSAELTVSAAP